MGAGDGVVLVSPSGEEEFVSAHRLAEKRAAGYRPRSGDDRITVDDGGGNLVDYTVDDFIATQRTTTARAATGGEIQGEADRQANEAAYGGVGNAVGAGALGLARGLTIGGSDLLARGLGADMEAIRGLQDAHQGVSLVGEGLGAILPAVVTGGASAPASGAALGRTALANTARILARTPAGAVERVAAGVGAKLGGGVGGALARGATEGAIHGAGVGVSQVSLSADPLTLERAASAISSNMLFGGTIGGAAGIFGKAAEKGLKRGQQYLDGVAARVGKGVPAQGGSEVVDGLAAYRGALDDANPWSIARGESRGVLTKQKNRLRNLMDDPVSLAESPRRALSSLRRQQNALEAVAKETDSSLVALKAADSTAADDLARILDDLGDEMPEVIKLKGEVKKSFAANNGLKAKGKIEISPETAAEYISDVRAGKFEQVRLQSAAELDSLIAQNKSIQQTIDTVSPLGGRSERGVLENGVRGAVLSGVTGLTAPLLGSGAPLLGAKAADLIGDLVSGRLAKAGGKSAERISKAVARFVDVAESGTRRAAAPATKILSQVRFGPEAPTSRTGGVAAGAVQAFKDREREIRSQTQMGPEGVPVMTIEARQAVAQRLAPLATLDPLGADQIETRAAKRIEYLASKLPLRPGLGMQIGPDMWRPSDFEVHDFARAVKAVEDPASVLDRLNDGTMTPTDAEALREVYPEIYAEVQQEIVSQLPTLRKTLPYQKQLMMSILFDVPVDPLMEPQIFAVLQSSFTDEPGTEGGTQAPQPNPQFGSVSKQEPTPAQSRAG